MKDKKIILRGEIALIIAIIINRPYSKVKITFDVTCLFITACMTYFALGKFTFVSFLNKEPDADTVN